MPWIDVRANREFVMIIDDFQMQATARRYVERQSIRERNMRLMRAGKALSVDRPERVERFLLRHGFQQREIAAFMAADRKRAAAPAVPSTEVSALERVLGTNDLMGISFLERGLRAARSVGRISIARAGTVIGYGTGFLVSPELVLTNHHVLGDKDLARGSFIEFEYEVGVDGGLRPALAFQILAILSMPPISIWITPLLRWHLRALEDVPFRSSVFFHSLQIWEKPSQLNG